MIENAGIPGAITEFLVKITLIDPSTDPFANSEQFFRFVVFGSIVWWVMMTGLATLLAVMFNLVTDVVGGLEVVILEEHLESPTAPCSMPRRPTASRPMGSVHPGARTRRSSDPGSTAVR